MNFARIVSVPILLLGFSLAASSGQSPTTLAASGRNTFFLRAHDTMTASGTDARTRGWSSIHYSRSGLVTNQSLQISCAGLAANQRYHLMASFGTNGDLMHLADFSPGRSGGIMLNYMMGAHRFTATNNLSHWLSTMSGRTNHMSWVIFPSTVTNWCDRRDDHGYPHAMNGDARTRGMPDPGSSTGRMGSSGGMWNTGGTAGTQGMEGMGSMHSNWPAMTNWGAGMTNWWPQMTSWCRDYTNMWNGGTGSGGGASNWWGSRVHGDHHRVPLPDSIAPIPSINGLVVMDDQLQPVLSSDLASPNSFQYQARCDFINHGVLPSAKATVRVSATVKATHFWLSVSGLAPNSNYHCAMNDGSVTSITTDAHGGFRMRKVPGGGSVMNLRSIWILDQNSSVVLSAALSPL